MQKTAFTFRLLNRLLLLFLLLAPWGTHAMGRRRSEEEERLSKDYRSLAEFAKMHSLSAPIQTGDRQYTSSNEWTSITLMTNSRRAIVNHRLVWMSYPSLELAGQAALSRRDEEWSLAPILKPEWCLPPNAGDVVILDPGHGGHDSGARGPNGSVEKELTLDIAKRVAKHLEARGIPYQMTRDDDRFVELAARSRFAAEGKGRIFVSIHFNSGGRGDAAGVETYALSLTGAPSSNDPESQAVSAETNLGNQCDASNISLAYCLQDSLIERGIGVDRGVRRARFLVLREALCPAALVECGFLTNAEEEKRVLDSGHREKLATAITDGIARYLNHERRAEILRETPPPRPVREVRW